MRITRTDVEHVARLARLSLSEDELTLFTGQMEAILGYVETLTELNTDTVIPTAHAVPMANAFRDDCVIESIGQDAALSNAPQKTGSYFLVPAVIE